MKFGLVKVLMDTEKESSARNQNLAVVLYDNTVSL